MNPYRTYARSSLARDVIAPVMALAIMAATLGGVAVGSSACTAAQGAAVATTIADVGSAACGALVAIVDPGASFLGTACSSVASLISSAIAALAKQGKLAAAQPCTHLTPIAKTGTSRAPVAWVCPGVEAVAQQIVDGQP